MIETLLIVDVETTGTDPETDEIVEYAHVLYSVSEASIVECRSSLVVPAVDNASRDITGISDALLRGYGWTVVGIQDAPARADAYVAHNASFDAAFLRARGWPDEAPWICTFEAFEWPRPLAGRSLTAIALAHGVGVVTAHRAINDCLTLARCLTRVQEISGDLRERLVRALRPRSEYRALVSYDDRQLAKDAGFRWDPDRRWWVRRLADDDVEDGSLELPFDVRPTDGGEVAF